MVFAQMIDDLPYRAWTALAAKYYEAIPSTVVTPWPYSHRLYISDTNVRLGVYTQPPSLYTYRMKHEWKLE